MLGKALLCLSVLHFYSVAAQGECTDLRGRVISHGLHYVPGPDTCTLCVCDNGLPKVCKAVLCSPPQDCSSFRVGNTCCEFICLDDVVKPAGGAEVSVRMAAGGAAGIVLLTVALVVYRVRKQKRRRPPHADDQRSLTSIGYISGSMGYMGGTCETALNGWKPPTNYMPRGEAPPPYDEVVAQCRNDNIRMANEAYHRTYSTTMEALTRPDETMQCTGHGYVNIPRPVQQIANTQNCYNAPLLQPVHQPEVRDANPMPYHPLAPSVLGFPSAIRLTGSLGAISNRGLLSVLQRDPDDHERPHNVPGFYTNNNNNNNNTVHTSLHRTIPRISTAVETSLALDGPCGFNRGERALCEIRRSFHKPGAGPGAGCGGVGVGMGVGVGVGAGDTGRSMPRNLDRAAALLAARDDTVNMRASSGGRSRAHSEEQNVGGTDKLPPLPPTPSQTTGQSHPPNQSHPTVQSHPMRQSHPTVQSHPTAQSHPMGQSHSSVQSLPPPAPTDATVTAPQSTLPLTVDKPSCVCSYEGSAPGAAGEDADDYRSECENCKSATSSRWVLEEGSGWEETMMSGEGTQTLQRRAPPPHHPPPATATLPQPVTKQTRTVMGPPSNWENWFNTIPDSDTESEEE